MFSNNSNHKKADPLAIEPFLRTQRDYPATYVRGPQGCAEDLLTPLATPAARIDREVAIIYYLITTLTTTFFTIFGSSTLNCGM